MRRLLSLSVASAALLAASSAQAANYVLAFAATSGDGAKPALTELGQALYGKLAPGDVVIAYDATHSREVARGEVPSNPSIAANRNLKAKAIKVGSGKSGIFSMPPTRPRAMPAMWRRRAF